MKLICAFGVLISILTSPLVAQDIIGWRTDGTGKYPQATPVLSWAKDKNVLWHSKMPASSNATPLLVGDRLYMCAEPGTIVCTSAVDGKILWKTTTTYFDLMTDDEAAKARADLAAANELDKQINPLNSKLNQIRKQVKQQAESEKYKKVVADLEKQIVELKQQLEEDEGNEKLAKDLAALEKKAADSRKKIKDAIDTEALTKESKELSKQINELRKKQAPLIKWRNPPCHSLTGYTSSTPVTDGKHIWACFGTGIVVCCNMQGEVIWRLYIERPPQKYGHSASPMIVDGKLLVTLKHLNALDPLTGKKIWTATIRARWGTPLPIMIGSVPMVVMPGGEIVRITDGEVLATNLGDLQFNTPVLEGDVFYFINGTSAAYRVPTEASDQLKPEQLWKTSIKNDRYYASALVHDGLIYAITQHCHLSVLEADTGKLVYEQAVKSLGGPTAYPSITLGGTHIFISSDRGTTVVIEPGREYKQVSASSLENFRASPVFSANRMYIRTLKSLWCIGLSQDG